MSGVNGSGSDDGSGFRLLRERGGNVDVGIALYRICCI